MFLDPGEILSEPMAMDTRHPRAERAQAIIEEEGKVELVSIMMPASNPVSPGTSSPPLEHQTRLQDFVPPTRPSSTPFPQPEHRSDIIQCHVCPTDATGMDLDEPESVTDDDEHDVNHDECGADGEDFAYNPLAATPRVGASTLDNLPTEIHECILDHLFGFRVSTSSKSSVTRWGTALRHSRRRELSELARVSPVWRTLIQERLYRHIKLKASVDSINQAFSYFANHGHLRPYIKHLEIWFPVFQPRYGPFPGGAVTPANLPTVTPDGLTSATYVLPNDNASLEEVFYFVSETLPEVQVLTLEGGERKKAPKVRHWVLDGPLLEAPAHAPLNQPVVKEAPSRRMPEIPSVQTLICKGQWNLIRGDADFAWIKGALPRMREWHALYSKPKSKSYLTMGSILSRSALTTSLASLNLCLEGDYRREASFPSFHLKVANQMHFCGPLAAAAASPRMEHFAYTGRVCRHFFVDLERAVRKRGDEARNTRLRSLDLTVKNCCHHVLNWGESASGITNMNFIKAFESLVLAGIRALETLKSVEYLRIRYVDLDSPVPPLNPYFVLRDGKCTGVWSDALVAEMHHVRPSARFEDLSESFGEIALDKDGRLTISPAIPPSCAMSLKLSNYALLSGGISMVA